MCATTAATLSAAALLRDNFGLGGFRMRPHRSLQVCSGWLHSILVIKRIGVAAIVLIVAMVLVAFKL